MRLCARDAMQGWELARIIAPMPPSLTTHPIKIWGRDRGGRPKWDACGAMSRAKPVEWCVDLPYLSFSLGSFDAWSSPERAL